MKPEARRRGKGGIQMARKLLCCVNDYVPCTSPVLCAFLACTPALLKSHFSARFPALP